MKIRHPALIKAVGIVGATLVRRLVGTTEFHFRFPDPSVNPEVARRSGDRFIYAFYHEMMLFPAYFWAWPEMQILISDHADGEMIAQIVQRLGFGVIRGSTTRGGARALREMTQRADRGHLCITPDGPRGPRRHVQAGLAYLGSRTERPIVGLGMAFQDPWRAKSWDQFAVPRPNRKAACVFCEPVTVSRNADRDELEAARAEVERRMLAATAQAEDWIKQL